MLKVTNTARELKNHQTGIDITITGCKEEASILTVKLEYRIVVVSNLSCFKTDKHKVGDVVQFVVTRTEEQFVGLHKALTVKYGLADLPHVTPSGMAIFKDVNVRKQKEELEKFLKMVVSTPDVATCYMTLEFLGVNPVRAGNFDKNLEEKNIVSRARSEHDIFEEEVEDEDLFLENSTTTTSTTTDNSTTTDLFSDVRSNKDYSSKIFDDQDYGGDDNEDISELLLPGTLIKPKIEEEDNSELLNIDDDFEKLLNIGKKNKKEEKPEEHSQKNKKPTLPPKPANKPSLPPKPSSNRNVSNKKHSASMKVTSDNTDKNKSIDVDNLFSGDDLGAGDILKYIQDQTGKSEEVDLFS